MNNVLAICHGRKHRKIQEINYETATFLDLNPDVGADFILDIGDPDTLLEIDTKFDFIINAFCPTSVMFKGIKCAIEDPSSNVIDGKFNPDFFSNIHIFLKPNGIFYTRPKLFFYGIDTPRNVQLMEDKMFRFGFKMVEPTKTLTFNTSIFKDFIGFRSVQLPARDDVWRFIQERIQMDPKIKFFTVKHVKQKTMLQKQNGSMSEILKLFREIWIMIMKSRNLNL